MSETEQPATRPPALDALLQVVAAGAIGALALPFGLTSVVGMALAGGGLAALAVVVVFAAAVVTLLVVAASLVPAAATLTRTSGGRVGWALIVAVAGTCVWTFAFSVHTQAEPDLQDNPMMGLPLSAVPYALVAGLLLRRWYFKVTTMALVVTSGIGLLAVLAPTVPSELDARLDAARIDRRTVFVAEIPGYHRVPQQATMEPDDPAMIPPARYITLYTYPDDPTGDCQPNPRDSEMAGSPCTVEQPGLTYTVGVVNHQYFYRRGTVLLRIVGTLAVDRALLRDAILRASPTADPTVYTTDIAGYESVLPATASGMQFGFADRTQTPDAMNVEVSASSGQAAGECEAFAKSDTQSPFLECVTESPTLHYERLADKHVYFAQHGSVEVRVLGGLGVDRNVLRDAAVSARPATDEELMSMLPPAPPPERSFMNSLKGFAKRLFG